jgi:methyltransferase (TIGR00027 family)
MTEPVQDEKLIRNVSDTALWAAVFRAEENERPDTLFRDPLAKRLAGERGVRIEKEMKFSGSPKWPWIARTVVVDQTITEEIAAGTDMVINLAAGLDTRPYRMDLPATLTWVEIDLPGIIEYKEEMLANYKPACQLERIKLNLTDGSELRPVLAELGRRAKRALIVCEGLLVYLSRDEVAGLSSDLAAVPSFRQWILDLVSPALMQMMVKQLGTHLEAAGSPMKFGPEEGPDFFVPYGWKPVRVQSMLHVAARLRRLPLGLRLFALLPDKFPAKGKRPWGGACLMARV